jgi:hypothetical protein
MSNLFARLLKSFPTYLDKAPHPEPGVSLTYDGSGAFVTIERRVLQTKVAGGSGSSVTVGLKDLTLNDR